MPSNPLNPLIKPKGGTLFLLFTALGLVLVLFISITLLDMFYRQIEDLAALFSAARDPVVLTAIGVSIAATTCSTLIAFTFGVPLAYLLARKNFPGKSLVEGVIDIPMMIPHVVAGIALYGVLMRSGVIGAPFDMLGVTLVDAFSGIVLAMLFMSLPYLVDTAREGFRSVDERLENVSRSLGASPWQTFRRVSFPLAFSSIYNGCILAWARGISEFSAVLIVAYFPRSAPILIYERFTSYGLSSSRPIAILFVVICLVLFTLLRLPEWRRKR